MAASRFDSCLLLFDFYLGMIMFVLCLHKDKIEKTIEIGSAFEQMGRQYESLKAVSPWVFQKTVLTIVKCEKCGRVKHIKSVCPE